MYQHVRTAAYLLASLLSGPALAAPVSYSLLYYESFPTFGVATGTNSFNGAFEAGTIAVSLTYETDNVFQNALGLYIAPFASISLTYLQDPVGSYDLEKNFTVTMDNVRDRLTMQGTGIGEQPVLAADFAFMPTDWNLVDDPFDGQAGPLPISSGFGLNFDTGNGLKVVGGGTVSFPGLSSPGGSFFLGKFEDLDLPTPVPLPMPASLLATGIGAFWVLRRRRDHPTKATGVTNS